MSINVVANSPSKLRRSLVVALSAPVLVTTPLSPQRDSPNERLGDGARDNDREPEPPRNRNPSSEARLQLGCYCGGGAKYMVSTHAHTDPKLPRVILDAPSWIPSEKIPRWAVIATIVAIFP